MRVLVFCLISLISVFMQGCATGSKGVPMFAQRANYLNEMDQLDIGTQRKKAVLREADVKQAWRHEAELPSGDYFWGGWISFVSSRPYWTTEVGGGANDK